MQGRRARRNVIVVLLLMVCGAAAGAWAGHQRHQELDARAAVLITPLLGNPFSPEVSGDQLVNLTTEAQLVTSDAVGQFVSDGLPDHPSVPGVLSGVSVSVPPNTQVLEITVRHHDQAVAVRRAQAFATTFLAYRKARMESAVLDRSARVKELVAERTTALRDVEALLAKAAGNPTREPALRQQVVDLASQISQLQTQLAGLQATPSDPGQVVTSAHLRSAWLGGVATLPALGAVAGLLLGLALTAVRTRVHARVLAPEDLAVLDLPVLGPVAGDLDGYRRLRASVLAAVPQRPMVLVLGPPAAGGGSRAAEGLAASLGSAGLEVIVVDADGADEQEPVEPGLSDVIADPSGLDAALIPTAVHVHRLGAGWAPAALDDLVDSPDIDVLFHELRKRADVVLVVVASLAASRTASLVRLADAVLLEVVEGDAVLSEVQAATRRLADAGATAPSAVYLRPSAGTPFRAAASPRRVPA